MAQYWWDKLRSQNKKRDLATEIGDDITSLEMLAPPDQMEAERLSQMSMQYTGAGEDGIVQEQNPVQLIPTIDGPRMLHEGEMKVDMPGNRTVIVPQRMLKKFERELNIPGFQEGGETQYASDYLSDYNPTEPAGPADTQAASAQDLQTLAAPQIREEPAQTVTTPEAPAITIGGLDTNMFARANQRESALSSIFQSPPVDDYEPGLDGFAGGIDTDARLDWANQRESALSSTFQGPPADGDEVPVISAPEGAPVPAGVRSGYDQILDMMGVDSKYWETLRNQAATLLSAQQAYETSQLEQQIARGGYSDSQANAMRGRLQSQMQGKSASMLANIARTQVNQQQALAQAAITSGISIQDAQQRWAGWEQTYSQNQLTQAQNLAGLGMSAERINESLGTNFTQEDIEVLGAQQRVQNAILSTQLETGVLNSARMWRSLGRPYDELVQNEMFLDENGVPIISENEYNLMLEPPREAGDFFLSYVAGGDGVDVAKNDVGLRQRIMFDNGIANPDDPRIDGLIEQAWDSYMLENRGTFVDNARQYMSDVALLHGRGDRGVLAAQENDDVVRWAALASGLDPELDREVLATWIENEFRLSTMDETDRAVAWFNNNPYYSQFMDTPGAESEVYRIVSSAIANDQMYYQDGQWNFSSDFRYPWYDPDSFYEYSGWQGGDVEYALDENGNVVTINGMSPDNYWREPLNRAELGFESWDGINGSHRDGAVTNGDMRRAWREFISNPNSNVSDYWDGESFDAAKFIRDKFSNEVILPNSTVIPGMSNVQAENYWALRSQGTSYYTTGGAWSGGAGSSDAYNDVRDSYEQYVDDTNGQLVFSSGVWSLSPDEEGNESWVQNTATQLAPGSMNVAIRDPDGNIQMDTWRINGTERDRIFRMYDQMRAIRGEGFDWDDFADEWGDGSRYIVNSDGIITNFYDDNYLGDSDEFFRHDVFDGVAQAMSDLGVDNYRGRGGALGWTSLNPPENGSEVDPNINVDTIRSEAANYIDETAVENEDWEQRVRSSGTDGVWSVRRTDYYNSTRGLDPNPADDIRLTSEFTDRTLPSWVNSGTWVRGSDGRSYIPLSRPTVVVDMGRLESNGGGQRKAFSAQGFRVADADGNEYIMFPGFSIGWGPGVVVDDARRMPHFTAIPIGELEAGDDGVLVLGESYDWPQPLQAEIDYD